MRLRRDLCVHRTDSVDGALSLLDELGDDAALYAGGTELVLVMKLGLSSVEHLVDVRGIPELRGVDVTPGSTLRIGAAATHWEVHSSPAVAAGWPTLAEMERTVGNLRVQTTGTVGGNLCFGDPQSDPATYLVAAGASVTCASAGGRQRTMQVEEFLVEAYSTALMQGEELLVCVELPRLPETASVTHRKVAFGERPDVTCAMYLESGDGRVTAARVVIGSMTGTPVSVGVSTQLVGQPLDEVATGARAFAEECVDELAPRLLSDKRDRYSRSLAGRLVELVVAESVGSPVGTARTADPRGNL